MYHFIVNPNSRSGRGKELWKEAEAILKQKQVAYDVFFTKYQGHATKAVRDLTSSDEPQTIVVLGGDGTINEAVNGILHYKNLTFGYIPTGSSNDFARGFGLPTDVRAALELVLNPPAFRHMNIGVTSYGQNKRLFAVSSGLGFDAAICDAVAVSRLKGILNRIGLGKLVYVLIALHQLFLTVPREMTITIDENKRYTFKKCYFAAIMNHRYEGGGVMFAPEASPGDGLLNICVVADIPKLKILFLLPTAFFGKHVLFKGVHSFACRSATLSSEAPRFLHTDGEPLGKERDIHVSCAKNWLRVITP